jgi:glycosyltransferase involved in cell wall biosynthesis
MKESIIMASSLLVVIPAINEEAVLGRTLDALLQEVSSDQLLFVSDGSTDSQRKLRRSRGLDWLHVRVIPNKLRREENVSKIFFGNT